MANTDLIQRHNEDVIFSSKSLEEFIRLIQRQGINNLTIYSVNDLLNNDHYTDIKTRKPPASYTIDNWPLEFTLEEIENKRNYFVFVRYSFAWEAGGETVNGAYVSNNEKNGRHVFVETVNDIKYYKKLNPNGTINTDESSVFHFDTTTETNIAEDFIFPGNTATYVKNGTFVTNVDNTQYVIKIRGFNDDGEFIGKVKVDPNTDENGSDGNKLKNNTDGYVMRGDGTWANSIDNHWLPVNSTVPTPNLGSTNHKWGQLFLSGTATVAAIVPSATNTYPLGQSGLRWSKLWAKDGDFSGNVNIAGSTTMVGAVTISGNTTIGTSGDPVTVTINGRTLSISALPTSTTNTTVFLRGNGTWGNQLDGPIIINSTGGPNNTTTPTHANGSAFRCYGAGIFDKNLSAARVFNAIFNDYAECRTTIDLEPGHAVKDNDDGSLSCADARLIPGVQIISDTYGNLMGADDEHQTPVAVAGRVLVYPYQPRENYHAGMAVCSAPGGTVDIMTREEIRDYPDCIVGIVSEIPQYERWGTDQVEVNGRIWIKVK